MKDEVPVNLGYIPDKCPGETSSLQQTQGYFVLETEVQMLSTILLDIWQKVTDSPLEIG